MKKLIDALKKKLPNDEWTEEDKKWAEEYDSKHFSKITRKEEWKKMLQGEGQDSSIYSSEKGSSLQSDISKSEPEASLKKNQNNP